MRTFKEKPRAVYTLLPQAPYRCRPAGAKNELLHRYRPAGAKNTTPPKTLKIRAIRVIRDNPRFRQNINMLKKYPSKNSLQGYIFTFSNFSIHMPPRWG